MKKYLCLALLTFFGAAILSPVMAVTPKPSSDNNEKQKDGSSKKKKKKNQDKE